MTFPYVSISSSNLFTAFLIVAAVVMSIVAFSFRAEAADPEIQADTHLTSEPVDVVAIYESAPVVRTSASALGTVSTSRHESRRSARVAPGMVFFFDHRCPYSTASLKAVAEIQKLFPKDISIQLEPLPMSNSASDLASLALVCTGNQGMEAKMNAALLMTDRPVTPTFLNEMASDLSLISVTGETFDPEAFHACLGAPGTSRELQNRIKEARDLGIQGVPAFLINDRLIHGALDVSQLSVLVRHGLSQTSREVSLPQ